MSSSPGRRAHKNDRKHTSFAARLKPHLVSEASYITQLRRSHGAIFASIVVMVRRRASKRP